MLRSATLSLQPQQACVLLGPSGSGKTTLLSILGCLAPATSGKLEICGMKVASGDAGAAVRLRRTVIGFVFQHSRLLPFASVRENIAIVGRNAGLPRQTVTDRVDELLDRLHLGDVADRKPGVLSGGESQRAAVARALIHRPRIILADEPTASLDWENGRNVIRLLTAEAERHAAALVTVTHDERLLGYFTRAFRISGGVLEEHTG